MRKVNLSLNSVRKAFRARVIFWSIYLVVCLGALIYVGVRHSSYFTRDASDGLLLFLGGTLMFFGFAHLCGIIENWIKVEQAIKDR